ncbi:TetR/AcrR family transcriptional regulator [Mesorhizobium sp. RMAD-H1]|uniref:TetR/AcrR family transcriptional regulator n=1 Tax=Mesorhizobium sp. RMAD-H1 TaxID=2587065 RepID=UPI0017F3CDD6|nr:TetR/AcrR family transcriptional regulator [Mesorhizobium sp. RMAD-H1]MBB2971502.1 AcrR family transcriptional regulator [Mesorhizobium sp. RMAD-H1]
MARPREFDRDEALLKARDAFWERGYEGTSISDLVGTLGLAPARIYAAFGSKEDLFREAVALYEAQEGGFVARALEEELTAREAVDRMLREAVETYTRPGRPRGCLVVSAATSCSAENEQIRDWLAERRLMQTNAIVARLEKAVRDGELGPETQVQAMGDSLAALLHGLSIQARDGVPPERLLALCALTTRALFLM